MTNENRPPQKRLVLSSFAESQEREQLITHPLCSCSGSFLVIT